ncbi:MAG: hypothetical protein D6719_01220 [Candidatus Dadabacteria bacterium]|nr:MAG: hypothetical protein D6719_01220 [Candidatus Dadabacteria bacterium]
MGYHPRIECPDYINHITSRTRNSELWFINNKKLEEAILGRLAQCVERYKAKIYAFGLQSSHKHSLADFPGCNRADFMRDLNGYITKLVKRHVPTYPGGSLWARRYSNEFVDEEKTLEWYFFYVVLQPVRHGLVDKISDYPGYNCFHDAVWGIKRKFKVVRWEAFNEARRWNKKVHIRDYTDTVELEYTRLPGYEDMSQEDYARMMYRKLEEYRLIFIEERKQQGKTRALGKELLRETVPGTPAKNPVRSKRNSKRPRFLCFCPDRRRRGYEWYFSIYFWYKEASERYRAGEHDVEFPPGTYKPHLKPPSGSPPAPPF